MRRIAVLALVATSCSLLPSCSWMLSRPPDRSVRNVPPHVRGSLCRPSYAPPLIDTWQAVGGGLFTLWALGHTTSESHASEADTFAAITAITAGTTALWAWSASYGFKQARACRELRSELAQGPHFAPQPMWMAPSVPPPQPIPEVEQEIDITEDQIDIHTRIRPAKPSQ